MKNLFAKFAKRAIRPLAGLCAIVALVSPALADQVSDQIDRLVDEGLAKKGLKPNAPITDEQFLRRIYLDVIGRVPSYNETQEFLGSTAPDKRNKLVDQLLLSEGYAQHMFTLFADILRIKSTPGEGQDEAGAGEPYALWVKDQLKKNVSYRDMAKSLLTANGYLWDNGAVGYYMRDRGMPFDNMSNTVQVFLGTRLACAQCHNHPFDKWTQMDYYEMAAYTYGMETRMRPEDLLPGMEKKSRREKRAALAERSRAFRDALDDLLEPLSYGAHFNPNKELALPQEFQTSKEGKPGDMLKRPQPVFNDIFKEKIKTDKHILENYADWVTDPDNPTFTLMIANRLWKQAMGLALIEPVDDIMGKSLDGGKDPFMMATNPALMRYLTGQMKSMNYDMKRYLRAIYQSKAYQRDSVGGEIEPESFMFQGPVLRRMTAEQVWDSFVSFVIPNPDKRKGSAGGGRLAEMKAKADALKEKLEIGNGKGIIQLAEALAQVEDEFSPKIVAARRALNEARQKGTASKDEIKVLTSKIEELEALKFDAAAKVQKEQEAKDKAMAKNSGSIFDQNKRKLEEMKKMTPAMNGNTMMDGKKTEETADQSDEQWKGYDRKWLRAAELSHPAPGGHFLREWGQADRDTIQSSHRDASVTQALAMLNGPLFNELMTDKGVLAQTIAGGKTEDEKRDALFLTVLARLPSEQEKTVIADRIKTDGSEQALRKVAWALINTREFMFVR